MDPCSSSSVQCTENVGTLLNGEGAAVDASVAGAGGVKDQDPVDGLGEAKNAAIAAQEGAVKSALVYLLQSIGPEGSQIELWTASINVIVSSLNKVIEGTAEEEDIEEMLTAVIPKLVWKLFFKTNVPVECEEKVNEFFRRVLEAGIKFIDRDLYGLNLAILALLDGPVHSPSSPSAADSETWGFVLPATVLTVAEAVQYSSTAQSFYSLHGKPSCIDLDRTRVFYWLHDKNETIKMFEKKIGQTLIISPISQGSRAEEEGKKTVKVVSYCFSSNMYEVKVDGDENLVWIDLNSYRILKTVNKEEGVEPVDADPERGLVGSLDDVGKAIKVKIGNDEICGEITNYRAVQNSYTISVRDSGEDVTIDNLADLEFKILRGEDETKKEQGVVTEGVPRFVDIPSASSQPTPSLFMVENINYFGENGGYSAMTKRLLDKENPIPLPILMIFSRATLCVRAIMSHANIEKMDEIADQIQGLCCERLASLSDAELREIQYAPKMLWHLANSITRLKIVRGGSEPNQALNQKLRCLSERLILQTMPMYLRLASIESRLFGLRNIMDACRLFSQSSGGSNLGGRTQQSPPTYSFGNIGQVWLCEWLENANVVEMLYASKNLHVELLRRSTSIVLFMGKEGILSNEHLQLIWEASIGRDYVAMRIIHNLLVSLMPKLTYESRMLFFKQRVASLPFHEYDEGGETIRCIAQLTTAALNADSIQGASFSGNNSVSSGSRSSSPAPSAPNTETVEDDPDFDVKDRWYGLMVLWDYIQDGIPGGQGYLNPGDRRLPLQLQLEAIWLLVRLLDEGACCEPQRLTIIELCIGNIKRGTSIPQSLDLLKRLINSLPDTKSHWFSLSSERKGKYATKEGMIDYLEKRYGMIQLLCTDLVNYHESVKPVCEPVTPPVPPGERTSTLHKRVASNGSNSSEKVAIDEYTIPGSSYSHLEQLRTRFDFLLFILINSYLNIRKHTAKILWSTLVLDAVSPESQDVALYWFGMAQASGEGLQGTDESFDGASNGKQSPLSSGSSPKSSGGLDDQNNSADGVNRGTQSGVTTVDGRKDVISPASSNLLVNTSTNFVFSEDVPLYLFEEGMQNLDVKTLSPMGLRVFQSYFLSLNYNSKSLKMAPSYENKFSVPGGRRTRRNMEARALARAAVGENNVDIIKYVERNSLHVKGIEYLWKVALEAERNDVGFSAITQLVHLYVQPTLRLRSKRSILELDFIQGCVQDIVHVNKASLKNEGDVQFDLRKARRASTMLKLFLHNFTKKKHLDIMHLVVIPPAVGFPGSLARRDWVSISPGTSFVLRVRSNAPLRLVRKAIANKLKVPEETVLFRPVKNPCKQEGDGEGDEAHEWIWSSDYRAFSKQSTVLKNVQNRRFPNFINKKAYTEAELRYTLGEMKLSDWDMLKVLDFRIERKTSNTSNSTQPKGQESPIETASSKARSQQMIELAKPSISKALEDSYIDELVQIKAFGVETTKGSPHATNHSPKSSSQNSSGESNRDLQNDTTLKYSSELASIYEYLFQILDPKEERVTAISEDPVASQQIWDSLLLLPPSIEIENQVVSLKSDWDQILPIGSTHRLLYALRIINQHLANIKPEDRIYNPWVQRLVERGGMDHLVGLLVNHNSITGSRRIECISLLLTIMSTFLFDDREAKSSVATTNLGAEEKKPASPSQVPNSSGGELLKGDKDGEESTFRRFSAMLRNHARNLGASKRKPTEPNSSEVQSNGRDSFSLHVSSNTIVQTVLEAMLVSTMGSAKPAEIQRLMKDGTSLIMICMNVDEIASCNAFIQFSDIRVWTERLLLYCNDQRTRNESCKRILGLCVKVCSANEPTEPHYNERRSFPFEYLCRLLPVVQVLNAPVRAYSRGSASGRLVHLKMSESCIEFYSLVCGLIEMIDLASNPDSERVLNELFSRVETALFAHESLESIHSKRVDNHMVGMLKLTRALLRKLPALKVSAAADGMIDLLYYEYLFSPAMAEGVALEHDQPNKEVPGPRVHGMLRRSMNGQSMIIYDQSSRCKTSVSRDMAFALLNELCLDSAANLDGLVQTIVSGGVGGCVTSAFVTRFANEWNYNPLALAKDPTQFTGLKNQGATCYMNSLLQQLYHIRSFSQELLTIKAEEKSVIHQLQITFGSLTVSTKHFYDTIPLCKSICEIDGTQLNLAEQKDANEFATQLFDSIESECDEAKNMLRNHFGGVLVNQIISKDVENPYVSEREEPFLILPLDIKGHTKLTSALESLVQSELLAGENQYRLDSGETVDAIKRTCILELPDHLIVNLKRFEFDLQSLTRKKLNDRFEFPLTINLEPYTYNFLTRNSTARHESSSMVEGEDEYTGSVESDDVTDDETGTDLDDEQTDNKESAEDNKYIYELMGIIAHTGTMDSGHYFSFIRDRDKKLPRTGGQWLEFNDKLVWPYPIDSIPADCFGGIDTIVRADGSVVDIPKQRSAYMLVYDRKERKKEHKSVDGAGNDDVKGARYDHSTSEEGSTMESTWENLAGDLKLDETGMNLLKHFMFQDCPPSGTSKLLESGSLDEKPETRPDDSGKLLHETNENTSMLHLPTHVVDAILKDNLSFVRENYIFSAATYKFVWSLQRMSLACAGSYAETFRISVEYLVHVSAHGWEPLVNGVIVSWRDSLLRLLACSETNYHWLLDKFIHSTWLVDILLSCRKYHLCQLFMELLICSMNALNEQDREGNRGKLRELIDTLITNIGPLVKNPTACPQYFGILAWYSELGRNEVDHLRQHNLVPGFVDLYATGVGDLTSYVYSTVISLLMILLAPRDCAQDDTDDEYTSSGASIALHSAFWERLILNDLPTSKQLISKLCKANPKNATILLAFCANNIVKKTTSVIDPEVWQYLRVTQHIIQLEDEQESLSDDRLKYIMPILVKQMSLANQQRLPKYEFFVYHCSNMLLNCAAASPVARRRLLVYKKEIAALARK
mmetsp:Transcript_14997/g.26278  ORF Transcript_14997/g.26278 Transcript_14997/m.26278 type:complete len:2933 (+) Transcript_14997:175-8973(+)|eukprot:CAMPEP_0203749118 /NCGR_PEP_ID=MMETSP0098-20131031/3795_1 /ASSEMBLY_ACC=CAM_ASM_000208 /TAXON_ID=96639 /ORGANISM=" , Strain NY0313808BC1" /LENGTH=2932 /DNA_ID=CAMNT_0050638081 /DNA_START=102 /DNA_END=8900 /DNA_ORIENTATION=-